MCPKTAFQQVCCNLVLQQHYRDIKRMSWHMKSMSTRHFFNRLASIPSWPKCIPCWYSFSQKGGYFAIYMGGANSWNKEKRVIFQAWVREILKKCKILHVLISISFSFVQSREKSLETSNCEGWHYMPSGRPLILSRNDLEAPISNILYGPGSWISCRVI